MFEGMQEEMSFSEKLAYLDQLPKHKMAQGSKGDRYFDIGTHRPWSMLCIKLLADMMLESATPMEIAFLSRRSYYDVTAIVNIYQWMFKEMEMVVLREKGQRLTDEDRIKKQKSVLNDTRAGVGIKISARNAGIDPSMVHYWRKHDPVFGDKFNQARADSKPVEMILSEKVEPSTENPRMDPEPKPPGFYPPSRDIDHLARYLLANIPGERRQSESTVDYAIRIMQEQRTIMENSKTCFKDVVRQRDQFLKQRDDAVTEIEEVRAVTEERKEQIHDLEERVRNLKAELDTADKELSHLFDQEEKRAATLPVTTIESRDIVVEILPDGAVCLDGISGRVIIKKGLRTSDV